MSGVRLEFEYRDDDGQKCINTYVSSVEVAMAMLDGLLAAGFTARVMVTEADEDPT